MIMTDWLLGYSTIISNYRGYMAFNEFGRYSVIMKRWMKEHWNL
jgi:hypothetical protein